MKNNKSDNGSSILVIVTGFVLLGLLLKKASLIWAGARVGVLSLASETIQGWIIYLWFRLAHILGWINSRILLTVVFYLFLTPLSFFKKVFSSEDSLKLKKPKNSLWV